MLHCMAGWAEPSLSTSTQLPGLRSGSLLVVLYLSRLIILEPTNLLIVLPALLSGFVVNPLWYIWLGIVLWRGRRIS
jgi:hypothetical protein